jgi:hypothetical protein
VVVPFATAVIVIVLPETLAVAMDVSEEVADIAPSPSLVTVTVSDRLFIVRETLFFDRLMLPAAFAMLHEAVLSAVVSSLHLHDGLARWNVTVYVPASVAVVVPDTCTILLSYGDIVGD